jgi:hypothetical protein
MSEHPPTVEKGALLTIVAATWMVRFEILHFNSCEHVDSGFNRSMLSTPVGMFLFSNTKVFQREQYHGFAAFVWLGWGYLAVVLMLQPCWWQETRRGGGS